MDRWRSFGYPGVTPISRKLLQHWADPDRENRVLFCQREAAETAIYLAEVAGRRGGEPDFRPIIEGHNRAHNDGLPRIALKMATGSGKTIVMAMLIAWQTANKAYSPRDARFTNRFLVVTPGITIRDRLREPDIDVRTEDDQVVVEVRGVDVFDPTTGEVRSGSTDQIALWMVDTDYDGESFFVRHCYFTGGQDPYKRLKQALKADIDADAWAALNRTTSLPFAPPSTGRIAVKVINDYGDEVVKIFDA